MQPKPPNTPRVEQDYRIFFIFMTAIMAGMYLWTVIAQTALRQSWTVIPFTILVFVHIIAHWNVIPIIGNPARMRWYIIIQSLLAFIISYISGNVGMIFALYMALIGETIGFLGANRWGLLAILYYLALSLVNFLLMTNLQGAFSWLLTAIPIVIFISLYVTLYTRQAEARERAQALAAELEVANRQLSEYSARVEDLTIANERQRMARELHDTLSQGLAGLILQLEAADAHLSSDHPEKAHAIITNAMLNARSTLADARRVIDDLRGNNSGDLQDLIKLEISRFETATGISCIFDSKVVSVPVQDNVVPVPGVGYKDIADGTPANPDSTTEAPPIPDIIRETAVRGVTEAFSNIARHSRATRATITLENSASLLRVTIQDNGKGFDPAQVPPGHYGLLGLGERIRLAGGTLEIHSAPATGTTLLITLPLLS